MGNRLREIFNNEPPSKEYIQMIAEMEKKAASYKSCTVCKHYSYDAYVSGMTHYEGDCDIGLTAFFGKKEKPCKCWEIRDGYV